MAKKPVIRVDWYADNWLGGVALLTAEERGVYDTIINLIYQTNGPLPDDEKSLARACNCGRAAYRRARQKLIDLGKIDIADGRIIQAKCSKELDRAGARIEAYQEREKRKKCKKNDEKISKKSPKTEQKNQQKQQNPHLSIVGTNSQQAVSPPLSGERTNKPVERETENSSSPTDCAALPDDRAGGLSAEGREAWRQVRLAVSGHLTISNDELDKITRAVRGFDGLTFQMRETSVRNEAFELVRCEVRKLGYALTTEQKKPQLTTIEGGAS